MYQRKPALERAAGDLFGIYGGRNVQISHEIARTACPCKKIGKSPTAGHERKALAGKSGHKRFGQGTAKRQQNGDDL
jgi:hypothetical protein